MTIGGTPTMTLAQSYGTAQETAYASSVSAGTYNPSFTNAPNTNTWVLCAGFKQSSGAATPTLRSLLKVGQ